VQRPHISTGQGRRSIFPGHRRIIPAAGARPLQRAPAATAAAIALGGARGARGSIAGLRDGGRFAAPDRSRRRAGRCRPRCRQASSRPRAPRVRRGLGRAAGGRRVHAAGAHGRRAPGSRDESGRQRGAGARERSLSTRAAARSAVRWELSGPTRRRLWRGVPRSRPWRAQAVQRGPSRRRLLPGRGRTWW
jgi:hypothetical protein